METCFRIFHKNYISLDILANYEVSSENSSFPVENAFNQKRRSKVWRSNGYYKLDSTNNILIIQETDGVDLTVTVAEGEYTSNASLATAIKTALDLAGVSTYTVSFSTSTFLYTITSNGVGGIFKIMTSNPLSTLASVIGVIADKSGALTYATDQISLHTSEFVLFDMGVVTNPDSFILVGKRNEPIKISPTAVMKIEGNETDDFTSPSFSQTLTYDDEAIIALSETGLSTTSYRYWKLTIIDKQNSNGYIEVGAFFLGNYLNWDRGRASYPLNQSYIDTTTTVYSEGGQSFSDIRQKTQSFSISIKGLQKEDIENFDIFFNDFGVGLPFFVSMDSGAVFSTIANRRVILCKFADRPSYELDSVDYFSIKCSFREEL